MIVLDTATLFYWLYDPDKLTPPAVKAINESKKIIINAISIWELGLKAKKGRLDLPQTIEDLVGAVSIPRIGGAIVQSRLPSHPKRLLQILEVRGGAFILITTQL